MTVPTGQGKVGQRAYSQLLEQRNARMATRCGKVQDYVLNTLHSAGHGNSRGMTLGHVSITDE